MRTEVALMGAPALAIAVWFAWDSLRWLRIAAQGDSQCNGVVVRRRHAYLMSGVKGLAAMAVPGSVLAYALGAHVPWAVAGPPIVIMSVYLADREWHRILLNPPA
jgi:hypothetical protein